MLNNHVQNLDEDESNVLPPLMKGDVLGVPNCAISDKKRYRRNVSRKAP